jgi:RNA polymerase sigma-70 factor (ECF subfamily)
MPEGDLDSTGSSMTEANTLPPASEGSTSSSLLERIKAQDDAAWQRLVDLYGPLVRNWCRDCHLRPEDLPDVFQEVFRAVLRGIASFRKDQPGGSFRGWLRTITENKIRDHFRRAQRQVQAIGGSDPMQQLAQIPAPVVDQTDSSVEDEKRALYQQALRLIQQEFEPKTWQAFLRVTVDGEAPADVAADLALSLNAVYKAKSRVLHRLRQELGELLE